MAVEELISNVIFFTKENSVFYKTTGGFTALKAIVPPVELIDDDAFLEFDTEDRPHGKKDHPGKRKMYSQQGDKKWQDLGRVYFHRAFPFDLPDKYISVTDKESNEYGMIRDLNDLDEEARSLINESLKRKYYLPVIDRIIDIKEQFGYSHWVVISDGQKREFSVRDTFKSIIHVSDIKILIIDCDGNRFEIPDVNSLEAKSYRKIELYL